MERAATLHYTASRPRRRSLESLIHEAQRITAGVNRAAAASSDSSEAVSSSEAATSSDASDSDSSADSSSESSSSSTSSESDDSNNTGSSVVIEEAAPTAPSLFPPAGVMEREFLSAFLPAQAPSIDDVCAQLQAVLAELTSIKQKLSSGEQQPELEAAAARAGAAAATAGRTAVSSFTDSLRLSLNPNEMQQSRVTQQDLLSRMQSAMQMREPASLQQIHSIYGASQVSTAAVSILSPARTKGADTSAPPFANSIDEYFYNQPFGVAGSIECERCGRHFGSTATLAQHEKQCGGAPTSPPSFSSTEQMRQGCRHCGRLMTPKALAHHENICIRIFHGRRRQAS